MTGWVRFIGHTTTIVGKLKALPPLETGHGTKTSRSKEERQISLLNRPEGLPIA